MAACKRRADKSERFSASAMRQRCGHAANALINSDRLAPHCRAASCITRPRHRREGTPARRMRTETPPPRRTPPGRAWRPVHRRAARRSPCRSAPASAARDSVFMLVGGGFRPCRIGLPTRCRLEFAVPPSRASIAGSYQIGVPAQARHSRAPAPDRKIPSPPVSSASDWPAHPPETDPGTSSPPPPRPYAAIRRPGLPRAAALAPELASNPARLSPRAKSAQRRLAVHRQIAHQPERHPACVLPRCTHAFHRLATPAPHRPSPRPATLRICLTEHIEMQQGLRHRQAGQGAQLTGADRPAMHRRALPSHAMPAARATPRPIPPVRLRRHGFPARRQPGRSWPQTRHAAP